MRLHRLSPAWLVPCWTFISGINADIGPYFKSVEYDDGTLGKWPHQLYRSSSVIGPVLNIQQYSPACDNDDRYILLGSGGDEVAYPGPTILNYQGDLVWTDPSYGRTWAVDVKTFQGEPYLTFWADKKGGYANAAWYMVSNSIRNYSSA